MLKYCYEKWNENKDKLEAALRNTDLHEQSYESLLKMTVTQILNKSDPSSYADKRWNVDNISVIDNGDYQGTLLFLIPENTYQPSEYEYLMTYIGYGSCSCCDFLQGIEPDYGAAVTDRDIKNYMTLCKDFITNMIKPYNHGWRHSEAFEHVTMEVNVE